MGELRKKKSTQSYIPNSSPQAYSTVEHGNLETVPWKPRKCAMHGSVVPRNDARYISEDGDRE